MNEIKRAGNPMVPASNPITHNDSTMVAVASQEGIARVQAQLVAAKNFPRDERRAVDRMLNAFQRESLASVSMYQYSRGGTDICDLSIRAAEAMAQAWGNLDYGFRELEQKHGESVAEAYCWDLETNTRRSITFTVPHVRDTRRGRVRLEDARDIYELIANQAARRTRACVLAQIPRDIQDVVKEQIFNTLNATANITPETLKKMMERFAEFGVSKEMIEKRIQRRLDAITPAQYIQLRNIYNSLRDGMGQVSDWFEAAPPATEADASAGGNDKTAAALGAKPAGPEPKTAPPSTDGLFEPTEAELDAAEAKSRK